jgi:PKD repeat protein
VTLTATDSMGLADPTPATRTITVNAAANRAPEGTITAPAGNVTIQAGASVSFAGTASDPDGDTVAVRWNFGDGQASTALSVAHTFAAAGTYNVTFTATDSKGLADPTPATRTITVNAAPAAPTLSSLQSSIFTPQCTRCHDSAGSAGLNLEAGQSFANLVNVRSTVDSAYVRVKPGDPANSYLSIFLEDGHRGLPAADIQRIKDWILAGAPNN